MEGVETVDVSWLHHSQKDQALRDKSTSSTPGKSTATSVVTANRNLTTDEKEVASRPSLLSVDASGFAPAANAFHRDAPSYTLPNADGKRGEEEQSTSSPLWQKTLPKQSAPRPITGRRNSWISSLSHKFSSGSTPPSSASFKASSSSPKAASPASKIDLPNPYGAAFSPKDKEDEMKDDYFPFTSTSPKSHSFLHNAFRRLSSSSSGNMGKIPPNGAICQRRVMNVDQFRDRCKIPNLDQSKLRRVAFCVDVEIVGISRRDSEEDDAAPRSEQHSAFENPRRPRKPDAAVVRTSLKGQDSETYTRKVFQPSHPEKGKNAPVKGQKAGVETSEKASVEDKANGKEPTKKQEKKKRSEEERKERKERKRRQAEANGSVPLQLNVGDEEDEKPPSSAGPGPSKSQTHPTIDPIRIYRRCCQLRETPVLKRVVDQISLPSSTLAESPGTVAVLDLSNFPMNSEDIATFSDWLAVVPVRKLIMENCALNDNSVRSILAGLLSTKTIEQMASRRRRARKSDTNELRKEESFGVVEKLSFRNNSKIGPEGWRHISLFLHLSKSLKALDLRGIPLPKTPSGSADAGTAGSAQKSVADATALFASCLAERFGGNHLEELLLSECNPTTDDIQRICDAAITVGLRRFGFANNNLTREGLEHIVRYFKSGKCEGLDLGGNDLKDSIDIFVSAIDETLPLYAVSFADCSLTPQNIYPLLQNFMCLQNLRFIDFSHNRALFTTQPDALTTFRRFLPKMPWLKRIHLVDVDLSPDHAIALAEILPECPSLSHFNILENTAIARLASATDPAGQEEACAVYASLMVAVRVSRTIMAVDIEVPSPESSEVVKALASQIVAYTLRNLERDAMEDELSRGNHAFSGASNVPVPEILQSLVGHHGGEEAGDVDYEDPPDEDYVIGGTGVVKALGVCLGTLDHHGNDSHGEDSAPPSGTASPKFWKQKNIVSKRPRDMSKNLLESARNIRTRIQSALVREDKAGNDMNYRRFQFLDMTLGRMIQRFEEQYPETRISYQPAGPSASQGGLQASSPTAGAPLPDSSHPAQEADMDTAIDDEETDQYLIRLSRSSSITSLHSRAMTSEEGHVHRLGQNLRRDFLKPSLESQPDGTSFNDEHYTALRQKLERLQDDQLIAPFESVEVEKAISELGSTMDDLFAIQQDAELFEKFKQSQIAAQINAGLRAASPSDESPGGGQAPSDGKIDSS